MCMGESGGGDTDGSHHQQGQIKQTCDDQDFSCKEESKFQFISTPLKNPLPQHALSNPPLCGQMSCSFAWKSANYLIWAMNGMF